MAPVRPAFALVLLALARGAPAEPLTLEVRDVDGVVVSGAIVWLEGGSPVPQATRPRVVIDQRDKVFVPDVTVVPVGTEIVFPNSDTVSHHVYSFARPNAFELPLYKGGSRPNVRFDHPGIVTLGCNIHDAMLGYVIVVNSNWFARADEHGVAVLADVPAGTWDVRVWSARLAPEKALAAGTIAVKDHLPARSGVTVARRLRPAAGMGGSLARKDY